MKVCHEIPNQYATKLPDYHKTSVKCLLKVLYVFMLLWGGKVNMWIRVCIKNITHILYSICKYFVYMSRFHHTNIFYFITSNKVRKISCLYSNFISFYHKDAWLLRSVLLCIQERFDFTQISLCIYIYWDVLIKPSVFFALMHLFLNIVHS